MATKRRTVAGLAGAVLAASILGGGSAEATVIWDGAASRGTGVFKIVGSNCGSPGSVSPASDATWGTVWRYNKPEGSGRCESHGISVNGSGYVFRDGSSYYLGWRSRLTSTADNNANFQWKAYPTDGSLQNWPVVLKIISNRITMIQRQPGNVVRTVWSAPISVGQWNHYVLYLGVSSGTTSGWVELWHNGVKQTTTNGTQRWSCRTFDGDHVCPKWGTYGATTTSISNYVHGLKVGTTYADVAPDGIVTPTPTPMPTSTPTVAPTVTPTPTGTPGGSFTEITPPGSAVAASTSDTNVGGNVVDNNLGTRWSGNGDGAWVQLDLGLERTVSHVRVAVYQGNVRRNRFDIQVSNGGGIWDTVFSGESSGTTTAEQTYDFADVPARFVRYLGHGNVGTTNPTMNSVTEISVFTPNALPTVTPTPTSTPVPTATPTPPSSPVELTPGGAGVSASTNDGNLPANTVDDSLATRWSGNGDGAWIQYDLGATRTVTSVNVAWYQGNMRASTFDVLASDSTAGPWSILAAGRTSSGTTTALETHDVADGGGRYLRIVGHGNTVNGWNSITEVQIFGIP